MKPLSEKQALLKLRNARTRHRETVRDNYETRAKNCLTCETKGACCTDAHFVNVHVTKLEAVLINEELNKFAADCQSEIERRIDDAIETFQLSADGDTFARTYACPLFEKTIGCVIHSVKPAPCIQHACYENRADLPPDELQTAAETEIENLNERTYKTFARWLPLPVWLKNVRRRD